MDSLVQKLQKSFAGDIAFDDISKEKYSRDASLFHIQPELIVFPRTVKDLQTLIQIVHEENAAGKDYFLTARSAGTDMSGGPLGTSIIIDFTKYFNRIIEVGSDYAITEPGVYYRDFDKATQAKG